VPQNGHNRFSELRHRGVSKFHAAVAAGSPTGSGACQDTRRSNRLCATTTSIRSVSLDFMFPTKLNLVEPPATTAAAPPLHRQQLAPWRRTRGIGPAS